MSFKTQALGGIAWTAGAKIFSQLVGFGVSVLLARLLTPDDFGLMGMILVLTGFVAIFGEFGFGAALIQQESIDERHRSSVFWLNIGTGVLLASLVAASSPLIAEFYGEPRLIPLTIAIALTFVLTPLNMVQQALLKRQMQFRRLSLINIVKIFVAGSVGVTMALTGWGVWSLVGKLLAAIVTANCLFWFFSDWRPSWQFDRGAVKELLGFSGNLLGFNVFNYWIRSADDFLIGRVMGAAPLGIYTRAYSTMLLPVTQVAGVLSQVMFPAFSRIQGDTARIKRVYLRAIAAIALATFPLMLGLFVVAEPFVLALYGPKWDRVIDVLRILSLLGLVQSLGATVGWIYQSQGRTDLMFRWGIAAGILLLVSIGFGVWLGSIETVAASYAVMSGVILTYPSFAIPGKLIDLKFSEILSSISGVCCCSVAMAAVVWTLGYFVVDELPAWQKLLIQVPAGALIYVLLIHGFSLKAYRDVRGVIMEKLKPASVSEH